MTRDTVTGLILAGGRGRRMDERDKGLVTLHGRPLVAHVAARLAPQVQTMLISANRNAVAYADYGDVVADDAVLGVWQGPLAGVAAGLAAARTEWLVTAPCDTPFLPDDLVRRLFGAVHAHGAHAAVASVSGRWSPACMLVRTNLAAHLRAWLTQGADRKAASWLAQVGCVGAAFDDADAFMNINTADDLSQAEYHASQWAKSK